MAKTMRAIEELTLRELEIFLLASKTLSFREVGRQLGLEPAHLSKVMKKIEEKMGTTLFRRSVSGVTLLPEAFDLVKTAEKICEIAGEFHAAREADGEGPGPQLWTMGSISFLTTYLLAGTADRLRTRTGRPARFRLIEFTSNDLVSHGLKGAFEVGVHIGPLEWTNTWTSRAVGSLGWKLYGRVGHPLGPRATEADVREYPFIVPTDWGSTGYAVGNDFCPLPVRRRRKGDEASTAETALELCRHGDQLTFVPEILASGWCQFQLMQEIRVQDWAPVEKQIFVTVKSDVTPRWLFDAITDDVTEQLARLARGPESVTMGE